MRVNFGSAKIPEKINRSYLANSSRKNTVGVLGSSKSTDEIMKYMDLCSNISAGVVLAGKNVVHGCGNSGIMGCVYDAGRIYSRLNEEGKPAQNLAIVAQPLWGDEDLDNCIPIALSTSEADRIEKFSQVADTFVVFPGSVTTLQEVTTLISKNYYGKPEDKKQIYLVGRDFFKGLQEQYQKLYDSKLIKYPPSELFTIVDSEKEINI